MEQKCGKEERGYRPRKPWETALYTIIRKFYQFFKEVYEERFQKKYGFWRKEIEEVVERFLDCGNPEKGFARIRCASCGYELLLPFSCKTRLFCPSCQAKRNVAWSEWFYEKIAAAVPHRQMVFSLPRILRPYFKFDRKLLGDLARCAFETIKDFFGAVAPAESVAAAALSIQTFSSFLQFTPHIHAIVAEGVFDKDGNFMPIRNLDIDMMTKLFRHKVLDLLCSKGLIGKELARKLLGWRFNSGFSVNADVRIQYKDRGGMEGLCQYIHRAPVSTESLQIVGDKVILKLKKLVKKSVRSSTGIKVAERNVEVMDACEFLARLTAHIPPKGLKLSRLYGFYSTRHRTTRGNYTNTKTNTIAQRTSHKENRKAWARLIAKVYAAQPMICPRCSHTMRVVAVITDQQSISQIISHLKLDLPPPQGRSNISKKESIPESA